MFFFIFALVIGTKPIHYCRDGILRGGMVQTSFRKFSPRLKLNFYLSRFAATNLAEYVKSIIQVLEHFFCLLCEVEDKIVVQAFTTMGHKMS